MNLYNSYLPPGASFAFSILASAEKKSLDIPINLIYFTAYEQIIFPSADVPLGKL